MQLINYKAYKLNILVWKLKKCIKWTNAELFLFHTIQKAKSVSADINDTCSPLLPEVLCASKLEDQSPTLEEMKKK